MNRPTLWLATVVAGLLAAVPAGAKVEPFPASFATREIPVDGATIHTRIGGRGPIVVLLHGFGDTGDMWAPLAGRLAADHTVVVPDLRGMGLSSHPETGYDKKSEAGDIAAVLHALGLDGSLALVTHDIGNMVGYAFAAQQARFRRKNRRLGSGRQRHGIVPTRLRLTPSRAGSAPAAGPCPAGSTASRGWRPGRPWCGRR
jgi:pimeloyl-ACP methyl ester carboxylesterase